jgi:hypothetical protein
VTSEVLERRLLKFFREARVIEEEQGVNILFLAFGFLKWFEDQRSDEVCWAPLILLPVVIERHQGREPFVLRARDDDLVVNVSLREKLRAISKVELPELPEGDDWLPSAYFDAVAGAVSGEARWQVDRTGCGLGFFTFSRRKNRPFPEIGLASILGSRFAFLGDRLGSSGLGSGVE